MRKHFILLLFLPVLGFSVDLDGDLLLEGLSEVSSRNQAVRISYYTAGQNSLSLDSFPSETGYTFHFSGETDWGFLRIYLTDPSGNVKKYGVAPDRSGDFDVYTVLKSRGNYSVTVYGADSSDDNSYSGLASFSFSSVETAPDELLEIPLNDEMLEYIDENMGEKIGRGECWDVAQDFLDTIGADWSRPFTFGVELDPDYVEILPGDIVQFESVYIYSETTTETGYSYSYQTLGAPDHTAVVYEVIEPGNYTFAHQNVSGKRYIVTSDANLNDMQSGSVWFYRPVVGLIPADWLD